MAVQREFFCPKCNASLQKSDAMMDLSRVFALGGEDYKMFTRTKYVTCPECKAEISVHGIVSRRYDERYFQRNVLIAVVVVCVIAFFVVRGWVSR